MKICKFRDKTGRITAGVVEGDTVAPLASRVGGGPCRLSELLESPDIPAAVEQNSTSEKLLLSEVQLLPPIDDQEVWAAGVTYKRSKTARMEESEAAASCYDRVYVSDRPELFLKATPSRVVGHGQPIRIRQDATWNVPEPELALVLTSQLELVGFTIGNDMSSRDIEGDNPLYLPQAKTYDQCCGLGPWITLRHAMPPENQIGIQLRVVRNDESVFEGQTSTAQMARSFENLIAYLGRDNSFPSGAFLLTGTGIVPDSSFTLQVGDVVEILIDGVGTLANPVVQRQA